MHFQLRKFFTFCTFCSEFVEGFSVFSGMSTCLLNLTIFCLQCVKLSKFETERAISFIPPDGEFELMK